MFFPSILIIYTSPRFVSSTRYEMQIPEELEDLEERLPFKNR